MRRVDLRSSPIIKAHTETNNTPKNNGDIVVMPGLNNGIFNVVSSVATLAKTIVLITIKRIYLIIEGISSLGKIKFVIE